MSGKLTHKQQKFVDEYLKCFNATEAARQAGYSATNGSLAVIGFENLRKVNIAKQIKQHFQASMMSAEEALQRIAAIARGDDGTPKHSDKLKALELIGKAHGRFTDRVEHTGSIENRLVILPSKDDE
jgi:phage terminase small subunit